VIKIYKTTENGLAEIEEFVSGCWINVVDPTTDEIEHLTVEGIPMDFITHPLDLDERARSEREDTGQMLILIRIPHYQGPKADIPYITIPLGIILNDKYILTVCRKQTDLINEFINGRVKGLITGKRIRFVLRILLSNATMFLTFLRQINRQVDELEGRLQLSIQNKEVFGLLQHQKSMVYFTTALKANDLLLERLQRTQLFRMFPDDEYLLEDVITENQQAIEMVNISSNILSSMMDAFASIISNNLNVVMKILATVTICVSLPTMVSGFFGMNVVLPLQDYPFAWSMILGFSLLLIGLTILIFYRLRWF